MAAQDRPSRIDGLPPVKISHAGIARTFQNIRLFKDLCVLDNLMIAMDHHPEMQRFGFVTSILRTHSVIAKEAEKDNAVQLDAQCINQNILFSLIKK